MDNAGKMWDGFGTLSCLIVTAKVVCPITFSPKQIVPVLWNLNWLLDSLWVFIIPSLDYMDYIYICMFFGVVFVCFSTIHLRFFPNHPRVETSRFYKMAPEPIIINGVLQNPYQWPKTSWFHLGYIALLLGVIAPFITDDSEMKFSL